MGQHPWPGPCDAGSPSAPGSTTGPGHELTGLLILPQLQQQQLQRMAQLQLQQQQQQALQAQPPIQQLPLQQPPPPPSQALPQQLQPPQHHQAPPQPPPQAQPQPQPLVSQAPALPGQMLYTQPQLKLVSSWRHAAGALLLVSPGLWVAGPLPAPGLTLAPPPRPPYAAQQRSACPTSRRTPWQCPSFQEAPCLLSSLADLVEDKGITRLWVRRWMAGPAFSVWQRACHPPGPQTTRSSVLSRGRDHVFEEGIRYYLVT